VSRLFATVVSRGVHDGVAGDDKMPSQLKNLVRARMAKTGESYQQALRQVRAQEGRPATEGGAVEEASFEPYKEKSRSLTIADTAFSIAAVRADESRLPEPDQLFEDPYASVFSRVGTHAVEATQRFLDLPFFRDGVRMRTRFIDDQVREGLAAGLTQVVLLGAGFDARGLRMPEIAARRATVYEVDTPAQLARKRRALSEAGVKLPAHIAFVPFEFDAEDLSGALAPALEAKGFRSGRGALFVWEGVIGYIDDETIDRSLQFIARAGGPTSRLVFTYAESSFGLETAGARTRRAGFSVCEEVALDELWRRYLPGEPHPGASIVRIGTAVV
jgi:methyltransferase (TIGR00027 family)